MCKVSFDHFTFSVISPPRFVWADLRLSRQLDTFSIMSTVQEIESAITQLKPKDIHTVADWLLEYRETLLDKKIEVDAEMGKLDALIKIARAAHRAAKTKRFP